MHREGHYGVSLVIGAAALYYLGLERGLFFSIIVLSVTTLPDKDHLLLGSEKTNFFTRHRGITHTFLFALVTALSIGALIGSAVYALALFISSQGLPVEISVDGAATIGVFVSTAVLVGLVGHIFTDSLTVGTDEYGIHPWWPLSNAQLRFGLFRSQNRWVNGLSLLLGLLSFVASVYYRLYLDFFSGIVGL